MEAGGVEPHSCIEDTQLIEKATRTKRSHITIRKSATHIAHTVFRTSSHFQPAVQATVEVRAKKPVDDWDRNE